MALQIELKERIFKFNFRARTSRGSIMDRKSFFVIIKDKKQSEIYGIGEAAPLPKLSKDDLPDFDERLKEITDAFNGIDLPSSNAGMHEMLLDLIPLEYPSIRMAMETGMLDLINGGSRKIFKNEFSDENGAIKINGLIWMGDMEFMLTQITEKVYDGFDCLKIKVGSLDFERECDILDYTRRKYFNKDIVIRLDANGAFKDDSVEAILDNLSKFDIHSIEQPIAAGNLEKMKDLCEHSPIPIGLDEELIGITDSGERKDLVNYLKPSYLVLKPTLLGGFKATEDWINIAEEMKIGWWITSALESNIGLNAISQFTANYENPLEQGLGTGRIYENNIESPLYLEKSNIRLGNYNQWDLAPLFEPDSEEDESIN